MKIEVGDSEFRLFLESKLIINHSPDSPFLFVGRGTARMDMYRGNFDIKDYIVERIALYRVEASGKNRFTFFRESLFVTLEIEETKQQVYLRIRDASPDVNRYWFRIHAQSDEKVYGCGEQMSCFNLRGKNFPLWCSEPGVGRNKKTFVTWQADVKDKAGGDYYTTNFPQPTFVSTRKYYCHLETAAYSDFDFRNETFHELQTWHQPEYLLFESCVATGRASSYLELAEKLSANFGRPPELPEWVGSGIILGVQGGTEVALRKLDTAREYGIEVAALWCQDWQGINTTSFGKRLWWNWKWSEKLYPGLDKIIWQLKEQGIRFLGYINPYFIENDSYFREASERGYLAMKSDGSPYVLDFGEFYCGMADLTNPDAREWFKEKIKQNLIGFGLDGWMADFGEYLPADAVLKNGRGELCHNQWPVLWARVNYEALHETGKLGELLFFMRSGYAGVQKYCPLLWAGDQSADWSRDDGLASVITAALSAGMTGNALCHSDIGGYTSLHGIRRSGELFRRWAEMAAFTPVMRTHEGNRPEENHQFDTDPETLRHLARMTKIYKKISPYARTLTRTASQKGIPVQRPLFLHYESDPKTYDIQYQYMFGADILAAPTCNPGETVKELYLPEDQWLHVWSGKEYSGGDVKIEAPQGYPAVFYRKESPWKELFDEIKLI